MLDSTLTFSKKQAEVISLLKHGQLKRINLLEGSVRSGKTWISLVLWAMWVATMPENGTYLMAAKTITALERNNLNLLASLVGADNFSFSVASKKAKLFGRTVFLEGASDARAENKIRGLTLTGAYCDELTLFDEEFFVMLLSRLSEPDAKLFATTNPDSPGHWLMVNYIKRAEERELDFLRMKFLIDDNPYLTKEYVNSLKQEYTGVFYDRFIKGEWCAAEGVVYPQYADNPEKYCLKKAPDDISFATIGVDFGGNKSAHAFVCLGFTKGYQRAVVLDEFYLKEQISPERLEREFVRFVKKQKASYRISEVYCDSAETTLICGLRSAAVREKLAVDVKKARKSKILDRIRFFNSIISQNRFAVLRSCSHVSEALSNAVWDETENEDVRLDNGIVNVDSLDALEYAAEPFMKEMISISAYTGAPAPAGRTRKNRGRMEKKA